MLFLSACAFGGCRIAGDFVAAGLDPRMVRIGHAIFAIS
jgi:hypothetical protein